MTPSMQGKRPPERETIPLKREGKWIASSAEGLRIIAHGDMLVECKLAVELAWEKEPSFERTLPAGTRMIGLQR